MGALGARLAFDTDASETFYEIVNGLVAVGSAFSSAYHMLREKNVGLGLVHAAREHGHHEARRAVAALRAMCLLPARATPCTHPCLSFVPLVCSAEGGAGWQAD